MLRYCLCTASPSYQWTRAKFIQRASLEQIAKLGGGFGSRLAWGAIELCSHRYVACVHAANQQGELFAGHIQVSDDNDDVRLLHGFESSSVSAPHRRRQLQHRPGRQWGPHIGTEPPLSLRPGRVQQLWTTVVELVLLRLHHRFVHGPEHHTHRWLDKNIRRENSQLLPKSILMIDIGIRQDRLKGARPGGVLVERSSCNID